jgi:hypothetical protein
MRLCQRWAIVQLENYRLVGACATKPSTNDCEASWATIREAETRPRHEWAADLLRCANRGARWCPVTECAKRVRVRMRMCALVLGTASATDMKLHGQFAKDGENSTHTPRRLASGMVGTYTQWPQRWKDGQAYMESRIMYHRDEHATNT